MRKTLCCLTLFACTAFGQSPDSKVVYKETPAIKLELHIFNPPNHQASDKTPAIVFFFGGGWFGGSVTQFYKQSAYLASRHGRHLRRLPHQ